MRRVSDPGNWGCGEAVHLPVRSDCEEKWRNSQSDKLCNNVYLELYAYSLDSDQMLLYLIFSDHFPSLAFSFLMGFCTVSRHNPLLPPTYPSEGG